MDEKRAVILVGHGAPPRGYPRGELARLKALEGARQAIGGPPSDEERELDQRIRSVPRTPANDPYHAGLEALAAALRPRLGGAMLLVAYNEFCAPSLETAVERAVAEGASEIVVVPSMLTPGGIHSEVEIPATLEHARARWPAVTIRYAWPFDLDVVAQMLAEHLAAH